MFMTNDTLPLHAAPAFHRLAKSSGSTGNIDCTYCFFLSKDALYPIDTPRMSDDTLESHIRQLLESHRTLTVTYLFFPHARPAMQTTRQRLRAGHPPSEVMALAAAEGGPYLRTSNVCPEHRPEAALEKRSNTSMGFRRAMRTPLITQANINTQSN